MTSQHGKAKRLMWAILIADLFALLVYVDVEFWEAKERQAILHQQAATERLLWDLRESLAESQVLSSSNDNYFSVS